MIHHKYGKLNKGADALSMRYLLFSILDSRVLGFELIREQYKIDGDFHELCRRYSQHLQGVFHLD